MSDFLKKLGQDIKDNRIKLGISKNKVAEHLKISSKYLQKIENGSLDEEIKGEYTIRYLRLYLDYFNMDSANIVASYKDFLSGQKELKKSYKSIPFKYLFSNKSLIKFSLIALLFLVLSNITLSSIKHAKNFKNIAKDNLIFYP